MKVAYWYPLQCLAMNLAIAGALCAGYMAGEQAAEDIYWGYDYWSPGCGYPLVRP